MNYGERTRFDIPNYLVARDNFLGDSTDSSCAGFANCSIAYRHPSRNADAAVQECQTLDEDDRRRKGGR